MARQTEQAAQQMAQQVILKAIENPSTNKTAIHPSTPKTSNGNANNTAAKSAHWLERLKKMAPGISKVDLETAKRKLDDQYRVGPAPVMGDPADQCPTCGGQGVIKVNPKAQPGDPEFGTIKHCRSQFHAQQRLRTLSKISNLSPAELEIRLSNCKTYYQADELCKLPVMAPDKNGDLAPLILPRSNGEMLELFGQLAKNPHGDAGMIFLLGPWGGGKTYACMGLVNEINLNEQGPALYITLPDLFQFLKAAYDDRNRADENFGSWSFDARYRAISEAKVIVVDEFDFSDSKVQGTNHNLQLLQQWFNERYRSGIYNQTLTVLASNSPIEDMGLGGMTSRKNDGRFRTVFNTAPDMRRFQSQE